MAKSPPETGQPGQGLSPDGGAFITDPMRFDPVVVEVYDPDQNQWFPRDYLGPALEIHHPVNAIPTAELEVRATNGWLVNIGNEGEPLYKPIDDPTVLPDGDNTLMQIRTARGNARDTIFFRGYMDDIDFKAARGRELSLKLRQEATVLNEKLDWFVQGQLWVMKNERPLWLSPGGGGGNGEVHPRIVQALPCIFNPDGQKNCHKTLVEFPDPYAYRSEFGPATNRFKLPVFCDSTDAQAQSWTWARVFAYLLFWLLKTRQPGQLGHTLPAEVGGGWPVSPDGGVIHDRNLYRAIHLRNSLALDPDTLVGTGGIYDPLERVLNAKPYSHAIEGMSWYEAFSWTCAKSGLGHAIEEYFDYQRRKIRTGIRAFVPGWVGPVGSNGDQPSQLTKLKLASPPYITAGRAWDANAGGVLADNQVSQVRIRKSFGPCRNHINAVGSGALYEVTVELVPFWKYDADRFPQVDFDPAAVAAMTSDQVAALFVNPAWAQRYSVGGDAHDRFWDVLRYWGIPDDVDLNLPDTDFDRPWGVWTTDRYEAFDLGILRLGEFQTGPEAFDAGRAAVRRRPLDVMRSSYDGRTHVPVKIEYSLDSGSAGSWHLLNPSGRVLRRRCGIVLDGIDDFRTMLKDAPGGPTGQAMEAGMAEAYARGFLRIRITGTMQGDTAPMAGPNGIQSTASLSRRSRGMLVSKPRNMAIALREDRQYTQDGENLVWPGGNSVNRGNVAQPPIERFFNADAWPHGSQLRRVDRIRWSGTVEIPGLVAPLYLSPNSIGGYRPGDEVDRIEAEVGDGNVRLHDLVFQASDYADSNVVIAGRRWSYDPGNGRDKAAFATTQLQLEDPNQLFNFDEVRR